MCLKRALFLRVSVAATNTRMLTGDVAKDDTEEQKKK
jgi:hypothetical protein